MQVYPNQFKKELDKQLSSCYLVFGDEPHQKFEIIESIKEKAKANGYDERIVFVADGEFNWHSIIEATQSLSLFSNKQLIELTLPTGKPGKEGAKMLTDLAASFPPDTLLIIHGPRIGKDVQKTKWFKSLDAIGVFSLCYPLEGQQLHEWIKSQLNNTTLSYTPDSIKFIADFCEGNLLAAYQEIEKLTLIYQSQTLTPQLLSESLVDQARFNVFQLVDVVLQGDAKRSIRILYNLESEGIEPNIVIWALVKEWQNLTMLKQQQQTGNLHWQKLGIWRNRQGFYQQALQRLSDAQLMSIGDELSKADLAFKQSVIARPFIKLCHLCLLFLNIPLSQFNVTDE